MTAAGQITTAARMRLLADIAERLEEHDLDVHQLPELLGSTTAPHAEAPAVTGPTPTIAEYVPRVRAAQVDRATETVRTYSPYWKVLTSGIRGGARWDEQRERSWLADLAAVDEDHDLGLEISLEPDSYPRSLDREDAGALIIWPGFGERLLTDLRRTELEASHVWPRARALAEARRRDRNRAARGQEPCGWTGNSAVELMISATRQLYRYARDDGYVPADFSPAAGIPKPGRGGSRRRRMTDSELDELFFVCTSTGNDPELDTMLLRFHLATGARQEGAIRLKLRHLRDQDATIVIPDKNSLAKRGNDHREDERVPVPPSLIAELRRFAQSRGSEQPNEPVFCYRTAHPRTHEPNPPLTSRRYDTLHKRVKRYCAWAAKGEWGSHWLRHHAAGEMEDLGGRAVKQRFLRHRPNGQTDNYAVATIEEVAEVAALRTGEPHPLARR